MKTKILKQVTLLMAVLMMSAFVVACGTATPSTETNASATEESSSTADVVGTAILDELKLTNAQGEKVSLKSVLDPEKHTLITVWTTWCPVCAVHYPMLEEVAKETKYTDKISFVMVNATAAEQGIEKVEQAKQYVSKNGYVLPVYFDESAEFIHALSLQAIPTGILFSPDGKIEHILDGTVADVDALKQVMDLYLEAIAKQ